MNINYEIYENELNLDSVKRGKEYLKKNYKSKSMRNGVMLSALTYMASTIIITIKDAKNAMQGIYDKIVEVLAKDYNFESVQSMKDFIDANKETYTTTTIISNGKTTVPVTTMHTRYLDPLAEELDKGIADISNSAFNDAFMQELPNSLMNVGSVLLSLGMVAVPCLYYKAKMKSFDKKIKRLENEKLELYQQECNER